VHSAFGDADASLAAARATFVAAAAAGGAVDWLNVPNECYVASLTPTAANDGAVASIAVGSGRKVLFKLCFLCF
jgi:hypothetical protein